MELAIFARHHISTKHIPKVKEVPFQEDSPSAAVRIRRKMHIPMDSCGCCHYNRGTLPPAREETNAVQEKGVA